MTPPRQPPGAGRYRGRFAPTPSGPLHLGSLYTALAGFLQAKAHGGEWLLRIDDADTPRVAPGAADAIVRALERFGLGWDGPVVFQSQEFGAYQAALGQLDAAGLLYPCTCSRKTLAALPRVGGHSRYPGNCRHANRDRREPHALRVIAHDADILLEDKLQGPQSWNPARDFGDFIVFRRDGIFAYHLATVMDDAQAGITEVLRGHDLLESTPLQVHLQGLLGLPTPVYLHIPIIIDRHGAKLSKQNLAAPVDGLEVSATLHGLLRLLGHPPPSELRQAPKEEILAWAVAAWDPARLSGTAVAEPDWLGPQAISHAPPPR